MCWAGSLQVLRLQDSIFIKPYTAAAIDLMEMLHWKSKTRMMMPARDMLKLTSMVAYMDIIDL